MEFKRTPSNKNGFNSTTVSRFKTPSNLNTTVSSGSLKKRNANISKRNLDTTLAAAPSSHPQLKSRLNISTETTNYALEQELAYNNYLQGLLKKQIKTQIIKKHKTILCDQIAIQNHSLFKAKCTHKEIVKSTLQCKGKSSIIEALESLEKHMADVRRIFSTYDLLSEAEYLLNVFLKESTKVRLTKVKPILSQEDYNDLIKTMKQCANVVENIVRSGRHFNEVHNVAEEIRRFNYTKADVIKMCNSHTDSSTETVYNLLEHLSNLFARQGKYD